MASQRPHQCQRDTWAAYYASDSVTGRFAEIVDALQTETEVAASTAPSPHAAAPQITKELLSTATHNIQIAQEYVYGREKQDSTELTGCKIPAALFAVPEGGVPERGPLYNILAAALECAVTSSINLEQPEWTQTPAAKEIVRAARLRLSDNRQLPSVRVYLAEDISSDKRDQLVQTVKALDGKIVDSAEQATHVVDSAQVRGNADDNAWFRTISKHDDGRVLVHWWYTPDSYDAWVPAEAPYTAAPEEVAEHDGAWYVSLQWVEDSASFGEWLSEEDYESPQAGKRRAQNTIGGDEKRLRADGVNDHMPAGVSALSIADAQAGAGPGAGPRKRNEFEPLPGGELANIPNESEASRGAAISEPIKVDDEHNVDEKTGADADGNTAANPDADNAGADTEPEPVDEQLQREEDARRLLVEQTQEIIVPSYAAWFNLGSIHENERRALPEFFNSRNMSKTPTIYREYRNFMINTYRLSPDDYLTVTACRRNLAGDVCAIMRVHAFLEQWGLINYQADAEKRPSTIGPPFTGHFRISADTPRGLVPFQPSISAAQLAGKPSANLNSPSAAAATAAIGSAAPGAGLSGDNLALRQNIYSSPTISGEATKSAREINAMEQPVTTKDVFCHTCGVNCTSAYYHCVKNQRPRVDLCAPCYMDGRFPGTLSSSDFVKLTDSSIGQPGSGDDWTDQETLLLLEAIEMYDDDWNRIAEHVGTRSREECVLHFLKLPIEDPYEVAPLRESRGSQSAAVPFSRADNPIMSVVAYLASNVNPSVAAAAAKAALAELTKSEGVKGAAAAPVQDQDEKASGAATETSEAKEANGVASKDTADMDVDDDKSDLKPTQNGTDAAETPAADAKEKSPQVKDSVDTKQSTLPPGADLAYASSVALGAAAAKASKLADYEERQLESMVHHVVELQMAKLELKMRQFEEMEAAIEQERKDLARQRQQLVEECWALKKKMALFESGAAGKIASINSTNVFQANDNISQITRGPTAPPKPAPALSTAPVNPPVSAPAPPAATAPVPAPALPGAPAPVPVPAAAPISLPSAAPQISLPSAAPSAPQPLASTAPSVPANPISNIGIGSELAANAVPDSAIQSASPSASTAPVAPAADQANKQQPQQSSLAELAVSNTPGTASANTNISVATSVADPALAEPAPASTYQAAAAMNVVEPSDSKADETIVPKTPDESTVAAVSNSKDELTEAQEPTDAQPTDSNPDTTVAEASISNPQADPLNVHVATETAASQHESPKNTDAPTGANEGNGTDDAMDVVRESDQ
ncbi:SWI/SNF and RSC complex subunit Ssr2 [Coemansia sp. Benny D115]|nr:SWI/SNF and RSC complex subunit Ssr2 [Coemansia sp. Benny D115]